MIKARSYLHRLGRLVAFLGLIAWAAGSLYTLLAADPQTFQRIGALGVAAAVLFFTDRLTQIELARQKSVERLLHEYGVELQQLRAGGSPADIPPTGYVVDFLVEERNFDQLRARADRLEALNILLLTLSTLQWGFGDSFLVNHFGMGVAN